MEQTALCSAEAFRQLEIDIDNLMIGDLLFVQAEFTDKQRFMLDNNPRIIVIVARENKGQFPPVHCIANKQDFKKAQAVMQTKLRELGGENITDARRLQ